MAETLLTISGVGLPPMSARGCTQELIPIPNGEFRKTVNGALVFVKTSDYQRYRTIIKCSDMNCPAVGNIWMGSKVEIGCIQNIWQNADSSCHSIKLLKIPADNSVVVIDEQQRYLKHILDEESVVHILDDNISGQIFISYRPKLDMLITDFRVETNEWELKTSWILCAEEI